MVFDPYVRLAVRGHGNSVHARVCLGQTRPHYIKKDNGLNIGLTWSFLLRQLLHFEHVHVACLRRICYNTFMKMVNIKVIHVQYNLISGLAWLMFWAFLIFFLGVTMNMWTLESTTAPAWWIFSAVLITIRRPFKTVTVTDVKLSENDPRIQ